MVIDLAWEDVFGYPHPTHALREFLESLATEERPLDMNLVDPTEVSERVAEDLAREAAEAQEKKRFLDIWSCLREVLTSSQQTADRRLIVWRIVAERLKEGTLPSVINTLIPFFGTQEQCITRLHTKLYESNLWLTYALHLEAALGSSRSEPRPDTFAFKFAGLLLPNGYTEVSMHLLPRQLVELHPQITTNAIMSLLQKIQDMYDRLHRNESHQMRNLMEIAL
jgi:hypothetical protein